MKSSEKEWAKALARMPRNSTRSSGSMGPVTDGPPTGCRSTSAARPRGSVCNWGWIWTRATCPTTYHSPRAPYHHGDLTSEVDGVPKPLSSRAPRLRRRGAVARPVIGDEADPAPLGAGDVALEQQPRVRRPAMHQHGTAVGIAVLQHSQCPAVRGEDVMLQHCPASSPVPMPPVKPDVRGTTLREREGRNVDATLDSPG